MQLKEFNPSYGYDYYDARVHRLWNEISKLPCRPVISLNAFLCKFPEVDHQNERFVPEAFHDHLVEARPKGNKRDNRKLNVEVFQDLVDATIPEMVITFSVFAIAKDILCSQKKTCTKHLFMGLAGQIIDEMLFSGGGATQRCKRFMILYDYFNPDDKGVPRVIADCINIRFKLLKKEDCSTQTYISDSCSVSTVCSTHFSQKRSLVVLQYEFSSRCVSDELNSGNSFYPTSVRCRSSIDDCSAETSFVSSGSYESSSSLEVSLDVLLKDLIESECISSDWEPR